MRFLSLALLLALLLLSTGCSAEPAESPATPAGTVPASEASEASEASVAGVARVARPDGADSVGAPPTVIFLGDSLTAGLGLGEAEAYPALVGTALAGRGLPIRVVNAGVSGDTTAGGLARLDWLLSQRPALVFVALGANDGLRAQPLTSIAANLSAIVRAARASGAKVVLAAMRMPPNYGPEYTRDFEALYGRIARAEGVPLFPFLLEGVAAVPELNQVDGIHPTAEGQRRIAAAVTEGLAPMVREIAAARLASGPDARQ